jgi:hypothetical protein
VISTAKEASVGVENGIEKQIVLLA